MPCSAPQAAATEVATAAPTPQRGSLLRPFLCLLDLCSRTYGPQPNLRRRPFAPRLHTVLRAPPSVRQTCVVAAEAAALMTSMWRENLNGCATFAQHSKQKGDRRLGGGEAAVEAAEQQLPNGVVDSQRRRRGGKGVHGCREVGGRTGLLDRRRDDLIGRRLSHAGTRWRPPSMPLATARCRRTSLQPWNCCVTLPAARCAPSLRSCTV